MRVAVIPRTVVFSLLATFAASTAGGHDMRLTSDRYRVSTGERVLLRLWIGDELTNEEAHPFLPDKITSFRETSRSGEKDLLATLPAFNRPVHLWKADENGTYVLTMEREFNPIALDAAKFTSYLAEEALNDILDLRQRRGENEQPGRERYARSLKAILQVGPPDSDGAATRPIGQRLEIVPAANPYRLAPKDNLTVQVLFEGQPLAAREVRYLVRVGSGVESQAQTTGADGRCVFELKAPGETLIRLVHMRGAEPASGVDWESFWSALTFEVAAPES